MSHYETLGVKPDASAQEIKRAYRSKAKQSHPDKGGKQSDFEPIVKAYEVLKDPVRRQLYGSTGQDQRMPIEEAAQQLLMTLINQALSSEVDVPVIRTVRDHIERGKAKIPAAIKEFKARKTKLEKKRTRVTSNSKENLVHMIIDQELKNIATQIAAFENEIEVGNAALKLLDSYTEDWKAPQPSKWAPISFGFDVQI